MIAETSKMGERFVRKLETFGLLSHEDKAKLIEIGANSYRMDARKDLVCEGDVPGGVFLVLDGFAARYKTRVGGARQIMAFLVPGDFCDLDVVFLPRMDHSIGTLSNCRVVHLAPEAIQGLLERPALARALRMATLADAAIAREWLVNLGRRSATERLAHLFCELLHRLKVTGLAEQNGFPLPLSQSDLADTAGLSLVHVNRSLKMLRDDGLIELKGKHLTIRDPARLRDLAEFQPDYLHFENRAAA